MRAHLQKIAFTEDEYFAIEALAAERHEYIDGVIYDRAGGDALHAAVAVNVTTALTNRLRGGPCRAYSSDLRVWSPTTRAFVYPDATVVCGPVERSDRRGDKLSVRNPRVVVEVVSPGSEDYDRTDKVTIYQAIPTVTDYLVVDPDARVVEHHARSPDGWRVTHHDSGDLALVGVSVILPVSEVFADLP